MIRFSKKILSNGLKVVHHFDACSPMVAVNLLYNVGAKDESPERTGFAHLFEHLMFGGTPEVPVYDEPVQQAGGENNAWTSNDFTNYYLTLPKQNAEVGFWLESDRMRGLAFSSRSLDIQRQVVIEEFKQRYLNQPYGDVTLYSRPLAYKVHPYQWPTIGKTIEHIRDASIDEVKAFFYSHYAPNNAVLSIAGDIKAERAFRMAETWFGDIERRDVMPRMLPVEPRQTERRELTLKRDVPLNALFMAFHMCSRTDRDYHATDLISDILSNGNSSRLYERLVKNDPVFVDLNAYIGGDIEPGLFYVTGKVNPKYTIKEAEKRVRWELDTIVNEPVHETELQKVKNKVESSHVFEESHYLNKAMNLALFETLGDAGMINNESDKYRNVTINDIQRVSRELFREENTSVLYYLSESLDA
ncbi:M16 family metallopeptidase [Saccharicrinis sp. FJH2]|uniref:M16 family metallopeptidase n=1 Tax=Saccharicrinis sp. FJH65 TaxID=3344659 RepID=UPI0035F42D13